MDRPGLERRSLGRLGLGGRCLVQFSMELTWARSVDNP